MRITATTTLFFCLCGPLAVAQVFPPNHLLVGTNQGRIVQYDQDGAFVQSITVGSAADPVNGLAFGPDGRLYAVMNTTIRTVQPDGTAADFAPGVSDNSGAAAFGRNGQLFVGAGSSLKMFSPDGLATSKSLPSLNEGFSAGFAFGPDGHLFVAGRNDEDPSEESFDLFEFDTSYELIRVTILDGSDEATPGGFALGGGAVGYAAIPDDEVIKQVTFTSTGASSANFSALPEFDAPVGVAVGPKGSLYVADRNADAVFEISTVDGTLIDSRSELELDGAQCLAVAPTRYKAKAIGKFVASDAPGLSITDSSVVLSYAPGSRTLMMAFTDNPNQSNDLASALGGAALVLWGVESASGDAAKSRSIIATQLDWEGVATANVHFNGTLSGKVGGGGAFALKKLSGALSVASPTGNMSVKIVSGKQLK